MSSVKVYLLDNNQDFIELLSFLVQDFLGFEFEPVLNADEITELKPTLKKILVLCRNNSKNQEIKLPTFIQVIKIGENSQGNLPKYFDFQTLINVLRKALPKVKFPQEEYYIIPSHIISKSKNHNLQYFTEDSNLMTPISKSELQFELESGISQSKGKIYFLERDAFISFVDDFLQNLHAIEAWENIDEIVAAKELSEKTEKIKDMAQDFGWSTEVAEIVRKNLEKALYLSKSHPDFAQTINYFRKIPEITPADQTSLSLMISLNILEVTKRDTEMNKITLTLANLLHDLSLNDSDIREKQRILQDLTDHGSDYSDATKRMYHHPLKSSELCRQWRFTPPLAAEIIAQHHELPDGSGFPKRLSGAKIEKNTAVFIIAQDFSTYFLFDSEGHNLTKYISQREEIFKSEPFASQFSALKEILKIWMLKYLSSARKAN